MDRYRIAPARQVCLSAAAAGSGAHLRPAAALPTGRRSGGAEIGIFTAERYFSAADVVSRRDAAAAAAAVVPDHELPRLSVVPAAAAAAAADVASQSGRTAASSEASWNSRSGLLSGAHSAAGARQQQKAATAGAAYGGDHHQGYHRGKRGAGGGSGQRWTLFGRDCPCSGRKAVTVDVASEPRSPAAAQFNARFSPPSAVDECLESDIFKPKHPSPPRAAAAAADHQEPGKVRVTVTPGSRAFPLAADSVFAAAPNRSAGDAPFAAFKADIDRRRVVASREFTFPSIAAGRVVSSGGGGGSVLDFGEPPRVSLEVFRPIDEDSVMLVDPPPPPSMALAGRAGLLPRGGAPPPVDEEAMSDASSDLFDLESFAASSSYPTTYRGRGSRRNSADDDLPFPYVSAATAAEPALSECMYPASEASVVWSVVTAEGGAFDAASMANFSSAASACCVDDLRYLAPVSPEAGFTAAMSRSAGRKKSGAGGGFLSSCRCEKAVSIGPTPVRVVRPPPGHPGAAAGRKGGDGAARHHPGRAHVPVRT